MRTPLLSEPIDHEELILVLERALDARHEVDKWYASVLCAYIRMGGSNLKVIPLYMCEYVKACPSHGKET